MSQNGGGAALINDISSTASSSSLTTTTISSSAHPQDMSQPTLVTVNQTRSSLNGWTELFDPNYQRFYYHNPESGETSWYHPRDNPTLQKSSSSQQLSNTTSTSSQPSTESSKNHTLTSQSSSSSSSQTPLLLIRSSDPLSYNHGSTLELSMKNEEINSSTSTSSTPLTNRMGHSNSTSSFRNRRGGVNPARVSDSEVSRTVSTLVVNNNSQQQQQVNTSPSSVILRKNKPSPTTLTTTTTTTSTNSKRKSNRLLSSISDQYDTLFERVEKNSRTTTTTTTAVVCSTGNNFTPLLTLSNDSFTIKDKFIILHLSHLTCVNSSSSSSSSLPLSSSSSSSSCIQVMEQDLKQSPLLFACLRGDFQTFTDLLSQQQVARSKALSESLPNSKLNPLHLAVSSGNIHLVKYLISCIQMNKEEKECISLNQTAFNSLTALHIASLFGLTQIAYLLIESGADTTIGCHSTPLAPPYFQPLLTKYLTRARDISSSFYTPFLYGVFGGSVEILIMYGNCQQSHAVSVEQNREGFMMDALSLACVLQHVKMVEIMLREDYVFNYDVNFMDNNGMSPIMFLAWSSGNAAICGKLLAKQANLVGVNRANGYSCLHFAIAAGNYGFIKKVCRSKENTEELAILLRIHNPKQPLNALQFVNSKEIESTISADIRKKIESILKSYGATEKTGFSEIVKEGYLTKQGHVVKNWKKRWFVLRVGELQYFKSIQKLKEPTGTIILQNGSVAKTFTKGCFVLYDSRNDKKYFILASSEEEMNEWMEAISFCINQAGV